VKILYNKIHIISIVIGDMNMPEKLTLRDIAKMAGVSPTVVSFVINGKDGVNIHMREKVLEIIKRTGFKPNLSSRRLTLKKASISELLLCHQPPLLTTSFTLKSRKVFWKKARIMVII